MKRQRGAILAICLVFLALLALMTVAGMESLLLHERMGANMRRFHDGFEAAEAALREAETVIGRRCPGADPDNPPTVETTWSQVAQTGQQWWEAHGVDAEFAGGAPRPPRYFVETWPAPIISRNDPAPVYYRITARGSARSAAGASVLQVLGVAICDGARTMAQTRLSWRRLD